MWMEWRPAGWSLCLPLLIFPCIIKSRSSLLAPARLGGPGKRAVRWLWCGGGLYVYCFCHFVNYTQQQQQQPLYGPSSGTAWVNTHPPTILIICLLPSTTIYSILPVQTMCLAIFLHNLSPCPVWSTSWSGALHLIFHTFLHPISVFFSQCIPIPLQPVCCSISIISSMPSLSLISLLGILSFTLTLHVHLTILISAC